MMKTTYGLLMALILTVAASGCFIDIDDDSPFGCVDGEGPIVDETLSLDEFDGIVLRISADVEITQGPEQSVRVEGKANIIDELDLDVNNGVWEIEFDDCVRDQGSFKIFITTPNVRMLKVSGSGSIVSTNVLQTADLELEISGSGNIDAAVDSDDITARVSGSGDILLEGEADELDCRISGSGEILAFNLPVREANVEISGSGNAEVRVAETLRVRISGSGDVRYKGQPLLDVLVSGSGRVIDAN